MSSSSREVILAILTKYLHCRCGFLHNVRQLEKQYPKVNDCDYERFVAAYDRNDRYATLYTAYMTIFCSTVVGGRLIDRVNGCLLSDYEVNSWSEIILEAFFYFKLVFPATLMFFGNPRYDQFARESRALVLQRHRVAGHERVDNQFDLCDIWSQKVKFLRGKSYSSSGHPERRSISLQTRSSVGCRTPLESTSGITSSGKMTLIGEYLRRVSPRCMTCLIARCLPLSKTE